MDCMKREWTRQNPSLSHIYIFVYPRTLPPKTMGYWNLFGKYVQMTLHLHTQRANGANEHTLIFDSKSSEVRKDDTCIGYCHRMSAILSTFFCWHFLISRIYYLVECRRRPQAVLRVVRGVPQRVLHRTTRSSQILLLQRTQILLLQQIMFKSC